MTSADEARALQRFAVMVDHLLDHTKSHTAELNAGRALFAGDPVALPLLDKALADLAAAHAALDAVLVHVRAGRAGGHGAHDHDHGHTHSHS